MWAMPAEVACRRSASSSSSAKRRAPASSPASARRDAGPSTRRRRNARRRAGSAIRSFTRPRKPAAKRTSAPMRSGQSGLDPGTQHAGERGRSTTGRDRDQHTIALDDRGMMKSQSAGRSITFTGMPAALATRWAAASLPSLSVATNAAIAPAKSSGRSDLASSRRTCAPAELARAARRSAFGPSPTTTTCRPARSKKSGRCFTTRPRAAQR